MRANFSDYQITVVASQRFSGFRFPIIGFFVNRVNTTKTTRLYGGKRFRAEQLLCL